MTSARTGCADARPPTTPVVVASIRQVQGKRGPAWEVRWRDLDGIHRSQTEHTEDAARDLCRLVEAEVADSKARARAAGLAKGQQSLIDATYRDIAETWLASITSTSTRTAHELRLRVHIYPTIGDKRIRDIVPSDITATMRAWSKLAQSTRIAVFGSMWATEHGGLASHCHHVAPPPSQGSTGGRAGGAPTSPSRGQNSAPCADQTNPAAGEAGAPLPPASPPATPPVPRWTAAPWGR